MPSLCNLYLQQYSHQRVLLAVQPLAVTNDDIKEGMAEQGVTDVRRITVRRDSIIKPYNTFVPPFLFT